MEQLGYVRGLPDVLEAHRTSGAAGWKPWPLNANPLNPAALIVVDKQAAVPDTAPQFVSPISRHALERRADCWFCPGGRSRVSDHRRNSLPDHGKWYPGEQARPVLNSRSMGTTAWCLRSRTSSREPIRHRRLDLAWYRISQLLHERTNGGSTPPICGSRACCARRCRLPASQAAESAGVSRAWSNGCVRTATRSCRAA